MLSPEGGLVTIEHVSRALQNGACIKGLPGVGTQICDVPQSSLIWFEKNAIQLSQRLVFPQLDQVPLAALTNSGFGGCGYGSGNGGGYGDGGDGYGRYGDGYCYGYGGDSGGGDGYGGYGYSDGDGDGDGYGGGYGDGDGHGGGDSDGYGGYGYGDDDGGGKAILMLKELLWGGGNG